MRLVETPLDGVFVVESDKVVDDRGWLLRTFDADVFAARGLATSYVQTSTSFNLRAGTLRGLHLQRAPHSEAKLVRSGSGMLWDVAVDVRAGSPTRGRWWGILLEAHDGRALYIPEGVAHGFLTMTDDCAVTYQISAPYVAEAAAGIRWDDSDLAIEWPRSPTVLSDRDRSLPALRESEFARSRGPDPEVPT